MKTKNDRGEKLVFQLVANGPDRWTGSRNIEHRTSTVYETAAQVEAFRNRFREIVTDGRWDAIDPENVAISVVELAVVPEPEKVNGTELEARAHHVSDLLYEIESLNDVIDSDAAPPVRDLAVLRVLRRLVAQTTQDARDDLRRAADAFETTCEDDEEVLQFARAELLRAAGVLDAQ